MTIFILCLVSFAAGVLTGAIEIYRRNAQRQGFAGSRDMSWPGRGIRIIEAHPSDAEHVRAVLRGDV